jgi:uncharacterized membrane protein
LKSVTRTVMRKVLTIFETLKARMRATRRIELYILLTIISSIVYGAVFSYFTILRSNSFFSAAWDLGNFNQAFYTTLYNGRLFYYTADMFFSPSGSVFAIHTSPILFLLVPFYAVSPSPEALLVLKAFGIGFAAVPLHLLSKQLLKNSKVGFIVASVYLLSTPLQGANWFDFQQSAFMPLFIFMTYYFMVSRNWKLYFPAMLLSLMIEEHVAVVIGMLAVYYFSYKSRLKTIPKSIRQLKMDDNLAVILTLVMCVVYLFVALSLKNSFQVSPYFADLYKASGNYQILGSGGGDILSLPIYAALHPQQMFQALIYDFTFKFFYVIVLFAPLLFFPLRNRFLLGILILLSPFLLSNYRPYYLLGVHYPFYVIPVIFIAMLYGLARLGRNARIFNLRTMIVATLLFAICMSPLSPISKTFVSQNYAQYSPVEFFLDKNAQSLNDLVNLVPVNASILTQNVIFPHVSNRINAYVIPFSDYEKPSAMETYVDQLINNSEYVLLDMQTLDNMDRTILNKIAENDSYGAYALGTQAILFKRGFHDQPINAFYVDNRTFLAYRDLIAGTPPGSILDDASSSSGKVVFYPTDVAGYCVYGPYIYLLPGIYEVTFTVKAGQHSPGRLGTLDVTTDLSTNVLSFRDFYGFELKPNEWTNITVPFSLSTIRTGLEFRVYSLGTAEIFVDRLMLRRVSSNSTSNFNLKTVRIGDIKLGNGNLTEEGFLIHPHGTNGEVFWYGPYWSLSSGNYSITFFVKASPPAQQLNEPVLTLSISGRTGDAAPLTVLKDRALYAQDLSAVNGSEWHSFTLNFIVEKPLIDAEFRGLWPSTDYDLYLAFILLEGMN